MTELRIEPLRAGDARLGVVVALGDAANATLGFMPRAAFEAAAEAGTLLVALCDGQVVGYTLFGLPRSHIRLTHLCVAPHMRGKGVAHALVQEISRRHHDRLGILAKCRRDYGLAGMWQQLGFRPRGELLGKARLPLVAWWLDHDHGDLFTVAQEAALLTAAIDMNVFRDVYSRPVRQGAQESLALTADHVAGQLELVVTPALYGEIDATQDGTLRNRYLAAANNHNQRRGAPADVAILRERLLEAVRPDRPTYPDTPQDVEDVQHLAEAAAGGGTVFITKDEDLMRVCGDAAAEHLGIRILRPSDVIVHLDELSRADAYRPAALLGTDIQAAEVGAGAEAELTQFCDSTSGERLTNYRATLRRLATETATWKRTIVRDGQRTPIALYVYGLDNGQLVVPLLRIAAHRLADTLARQLLFLLRQHCRDLGATVLHLSDPHLSHHVKRAAMLDNMSEADGDLYGLVIDACGTADQIEQATETAAAVAGLDHALRLRPGLPAAAAAEIERTLWPAKICDSALPCYIVPIQPRWSIGLFGVPDTLPLRPTELGLSREHVYYRSPLGRRPIAPARLLWYMSKGSRDRPHASIVACSLLEQVVTATPDALHSRFRHLGVWERRDLDASVRHGQAQALRFTNTEVLPVQLDRARLDNLAEQHRHTLALQSLHKIPTELFSAIYREGRRTGDKP